MYVTKSVSYFVSGLMLDIKVNTRMSCQDKKAVNYTSSDNNVINTQDNTLVYKYIRLNQDNQAKNSSKCMGLSSIVILNFVANIFCHCLFAGGQSWYLYNP